MIYEKGKNFLKIFDKTQFAPRHILECGQVFSYEKTNQGYVVFSLDKKCEITEKENFYLLQTDDADYFENYFDLKTDYKQIKQELSKFEIMQKPMQFGSGIRILKQDLFETLIEFVISANNNIKRIQSILQKIRQGLGKDMGDYFAFPTQEEMKKADVDFFLSIGAGYRARYLFEVIRQFDENDLESWRDLKTDDLRKKLTSLIGVGPKVADCILLFGYGKGDVFPVDTWIHQMHNKFFSPLENKEKIRNNLIDLMKNLSGYAQQYLFFYIREGQM